MRVISNSLKTFTFPGLNRNIALFDKFSFQTSSYILIFARFFSRQSCSTLLLFHVYDYIYICILGRNKKFHQSTAISKISTEFLRYYMVVYRFSKARRSIISNGRENCEQRSTMQRVFHHRAPSLVTSEAVPFNDACHGSGNLISL